MNKFFSFPNPVNEAAARTVAIGVTLMSILAFVTGMPWVVVVIAYGFLARVLAGPKISPLGTFAAKVAAPRLKRWESFVPGPPKRFAQALGLTFALTTIALWLSVGWLDARWVLLAIIGAATLEGFFGYCIGCTVFGFLIRHGIIPESVCADCADLSNRYKRITNDAK
jgi:hypothetical protein